MMNSFFTKIKSYLNTKYNHAITPFYEHYYKNVDSASLGLNSKQRKNSIVVSIASYPARFDTLHLCIKSILNQSVKPDILNLYLDDYVKDEEIPQSLLDLTQHGLSIKKVPYNLRSHKKYFFAMQEYKDDIVITFDDDVIYRKNTIKKLLQSYSKYPYAVSAMRVHKITGEKDGTVKKYSQWKKEYTRLTKPSFQLCAVGVGGILYPPHILPKETFAISAIKENCYTADDIWLKYMEDKNNIPVVWKKTVHTHPVEIAQQRDTGLNLINVGKNGNDECIHKMEMFTGINLASFRQKKISFITAHNWDTKRQGGFHKFAEYSALHGFQTVFFSFPRPYYGLFMNREQINKDIIHSLSHGRTYLLSPGKTLLNVTFPTFRLPDSLGRFLPAQFMNFCLTHSLHSFKRFVKKYLSETDCFVFESCEGVAFVDKIKKLFPRAKIVYRPSDPLVYDSVPKRVKLLERNMLYKADNVLIVNNEGVELYRKCIPEFDTRVTYSVLTNGIDIESYTKSYPAPGVLKDKKTVLYVGAWEVEWNLIFRAAKETPTLHYVVVCPNYPSSSVIKEIEKCTTVTYIPGIKPSEVPAWITNCTVVMVPYATDFYKDRPLGITAKYYQAMAAKKPIVAYSDTPKLRDAGIPVTYTYEDFIAEIKKAITLPNRSYTFNLADRNWQEICKQFLKEISI